MRRSTLDLVHCPRCRRGALEPETDGAELLFGPVRCAQCQTSFPIAEGVLDLHGERGEAPFVQRSFEHATVARAYERYIRAALHVALGRQRLDRETEYLLYRSLLDNPAGPILDLGCGTGLMARLLTRESRSGTIIGLDVSKPMLEEAIAQAREAGARIDFIRSEMPELPFENASLGAVLHAHGPHFIEDVASLFTEVERVLKPGGRYVASALLPSSGWANRIRMRAGIFPRDENTLKRALEAAGLVRYERLIFAPWMIFKAEKSSQAVASTQG